MGTLYGPGIDNVIKRHVVSGGAVTSVSFTGLNGNAYKRWRLEMLLINATASPATITLQPNGVATDQKYSVHVAPSSGATGTDMTIGVVRASESALLLVEINPKEVSGMDRFAIAMTAQRQAGASAIIASYSCAEWIGTGEMTRLDVVSSVATAIANDSEIILRGYR